MMCSIAHDDRTTIPEKISAPSLALLDTKQGNLSSGAVGRAATGSNWSLWE
jgi:hypothetical protein